MTIPALMLAVGIVTILVWIAICCHFDTDRPKPFDFEGWDNGLVKYK